MLESWTIDARFVKFFEKGLKVWFQSPAASSKARQIEETQETKKQYLSTLYHP
jgi:hypothetical protein